MDDTQKMKLKLNAIYGKQIYNLTKAEKEYLINDTTATICAYLSNRCCGKTWWLNSFYIDTDTITMVNESNARQLSRTRIMFSQLNRKDINMNSNLKQLYDKFIGRSGATYEKNRFPKENIKGCTGFTATECVDWNCPIALKEQYPDRMVDAPTSCNECYYKTGLCKDCVFENTIYCTKGE